MASNWTPTKLPVIQKDGLGGFMVFNATFNNVSVIS